jgi:DDE superfamily endonuclease
VSGRVIPTEKAGSHHLDFGHEWGGKLGGLLSMMEWFDRESTHHGGTPMSLPPEIVTLWAHFAPLFSQPVAAHAQVLLIGALLATGQRTVTAALRIMGLAQETHFTNYHRVLNRAAWSARMASRILLGLIVQLLIPKDWPIVLGADDTIERRSGRKIKARGCYRDAVRSSRKMVIKCFGLKWVSMMVLVRPPWSQQVHALPVLTALCWPEGTSKRPTHRTAIDCVGQMVVQLRRWFPDREIVLVLDGGYAAVKLAQACRRQRVALICRLRLDAGLYDPPPAPIPGKRGPKPKKGTRQLKLSERARRADTPWEEHELEWYGGQRKSLRLFSRSGLWYTPGQHPVAIRYVLVRDPEGELSDAAYLCTDDRMLPRQIVEYMVWRWAVEVTFEEARAHLGMETQRQWSDLAIARTTPVLLGLYSWVILAASFYHEQGILSPDQTAWYTKEEPTFSDCLRLVRERIWRERISLGSCENSDLIQLTRSAVDALIHGLAAAA